MATDQEGGSVQSLKGPGFTLIPTAVEQGQLSTAELAQQTALWAAELSSAGITLDLAPVADVVPAGTSTVKHFPGLGRVRANTDTSTGAVDSQTTVDDPALQPFVAGIQAGAAAVMISSAAYPQLDPNELAPFSSAVITDLLRGRLGFGGVVVSDDLGRAVAVQGRPAGQRAVDFVRAGGDLILTVVGSDIALMADALIVAAGDPAFAARIDDAALHVLTTKQDAGLLVCG